MGCGAGTNGVPGRPCGTPVRPLLGSSGEDGTERRGMGRCTTGNGSAGRGTGELVAERTGGSGGGPWADAGWGKAEQSPTQAIIAQRYNDLISQTGTTSRTGAEA